MTMRLLVAAILGAGAAAAGLAAAATSSLKRTPLLAQSLPAGTAVHYVRGGRVVFPPGAPTGRHLHAAPVVEIVTAGSFVFQPHGQPARTLQTGDAFYEPANVPIERFDNASRDRPAAITGFYLLDRADQPPITMLGT